jgi:hypothetical protein
VAALSACTVDYGGIRNGLERSKPKHRYPFVQVSQLT